MISVAGDQQLPRDRPPIIVFADTFLELSETFIGEELAALTRLGVETHVEAARRAERPHQEEARASSANYWEDDSRLLKLSAVAWLVIRHPLRCAADLRSRRRWRREDAIVPLRSIAPAAWRLARGREVHVHAHFAAGAALSAMRIARIAGRPYSVTAHAYDIFQTPRNLREKLERAAFATTGCCYNVEHLRAVAPKAQVHEIVMGVDGSRFLRRQPYTPGRSLVAVGRLVEKKGFAYLIDAVSLLERRGFEINGLEILGDGPLREQLLQQITDLGLEGKVVLAGAVEHSAVRDGIERAALLVMPSIVAADGDRDSMPVVVKEALALEVPVVASDAVGLPEVVRPAWGRLTRPGDPASVADAIAELLALPRELRIQMGRAGRTHVLEHCNVDHEAERLLLLVERSQHEHAMLDRGPDHRR